MFWYVKGCPEETSSKGGLCVWWSLVSVVVVIVIGVWWRFSSKSGLHVVYGGHWFWWWLSCKYWLCKSLSKHWFVFTYLNRVIFYFLIGFFYFNIVKMILIRNHFCCGNHCVMLTLLFCFGTTTCVRTILTFKRWCEKENTMKLSLNYIKAACIVHIIFFVNGNQAMIEKGVSF